MVPNLIEHIKRVYFYRFPLIKLHLVRQYTGLKHIFCEDSMLKTRFHGAVLFFHSTIQLGLSDHINTETKLRPLPQYSFQSIKEITVLIIQGLRRDQKSRGGGANFTMNIWIYHSTGVNQSTERGFNQMNVRKFHCSIKQTLNFKEN